MKSLLIFGLLGIAAVVLLLPTVRTASSAARRVQCTNSLRLIGLALNQYADVYGAYPPAYTTDAEGKPLHSWRTLILPNLEEQKLYESIDLSKPWDDPANAAALRQRVVAFECPSVPDLGNKTTYLAVVTDESFLRSTEPREHSSFAGQPSYALTVIEVPAERATAWMSPVDADEDDVMQMGSSPKPAHVGGVNVLFADGSTRFLADDTAAEVRQALIVGDAAVGIRRDD